MNIRNIITGMLLLFPLAAGANCVRVTGTGSLTPALISAGYTAKGWTGSADALNGSLGLPNIVSLSNSSSFMPSGTLLASASASFLTAGSNVAYNANQILYRCALTDAGSLYEMYATNGDDDRGGKWETDEVEGAYYTWVANVAIRITNNSTGQYYSRYWQSRTLTADDWVQDDNYIYIPASAFSDVTTELFRINSTTYFGDSSNRYTYAYPGPNAYIAFKGPGLITNNLTVGMDSNSYSYGFSEYWPGDFALYRYVTFVRGAMCMVKEYPSVVLMPSITVSELNAGNVSQQNFSVSLSCQDSAVSSVASSTASSANVAMGFMVNQTTALTAARNLGLVQTAGGITHLLDNNYGAAGVASGVGIRIYNESGAALNLLPSRTTNTNNAGGWYAYKDLTSSQNDSTDGVTTYTGNFTASLEAISGQTVTAGTVNAQLQVVVSFQ